MSCEKRAPITDAGKSPHFHRCQPGDSYTLRDSYNVPQLPKGREGASFCVGRRNCHSQRNLVSTLYSRVQTVRAPRPQELQGPLLCGAQAPRMVPLCVGQTKWPQRKSDVDSGHSVLPVNSAGQAHPHPGCDARSGLQGRHEVFTLPPR